MTASDSRFSRVVWESSATVVSQALARFAEKKARKQTRTTVIVIETNPEKRVPGDNSWRDVPIAETSAMPSVRTARRAYQKAREKERYYL